MLNLFDRLPDKIFRPLAASNRRFYAALLLHLYDRTFGSVGDTPRRVDVIAEIGDFIELYSVTNGPLEEDAEITAEQRRAASREAKGQDLRRYFAFAYLVDSGWLVEMRDRFRKLVDLAPEGRLLLREFQKIVSGDTRSYGGAVLNVLGSLETAAANPDDRSEGIRNAWQFSLDFSHHLRTLAAQMRRVEEHVLSQEGLRSLFRAFFEDFVSKYLIEDYKTLYTKNNPFRFRYDILERVRLIEGDPLLLTRLARAYVREGRGAVDAVAEQAILHELQEVYRVFDGIDRQLDVITETQLRIERKIQTVVRYMDRHDGGAIERATQALQKLGGAGIDPAGEIPIDPYLFILDPLLGGDILYTQRAPKRAIGRSRLREVPIDPALQAFHRAKLDYAKRVAVSPKRIQDFLVRVLEGRTAIRGSEIPVEGVDDFVVFQRLRDVPFMFDGLLAREFQVTLLERRAANEWLDFPDFEIRRLDRREAQHAG